MSSVDEDELIPINDLKAGDEDAFRQVVEKYKDAILNICYGYLRNRADAEDLAQDVFVEVYHSIKSFRENSSLYTWMYRIAVTKCLDELRYRKRLKRRAWYKSRQWDEETEPEIDELDGQYPDPQDNLEQQQRIEFIQHALQKLPETQREAFTLIHFDGLSYKETAKAMSKTNSAVESLVHRAKQNLKKYLYDFYNQ